MTWNTNIWAAREADARADRTERQATYWKNIGASSDKPKSKRRFPIPKEQSAKDAFGWDAGKNEITSGEIWETMIGLEVARDTFLDNQIKARELRDQSDALVSRLERMGIQGRTPRGETAVVGLVTGEAERATDYRNCNLIPAQQSKNVHDMLRHVRFLTDVTKTGRLRMLVVSGGWCPIDEYRKHHKAHTRRMSKFASHPKLKSLGISIEYYNVENTIHRDASGTAMMNMHSHVLYRCDRHLGKKWGEFLEFGGGFFPKRYVNDSKIKKPNEAVKYVFKPSELEALKDVELAELFMQIVGGREKVDDETGEVLCRPGPDGELVAILEGPLKFFHPLGEMRRFRSELRANGQKLILVPTKDDRWIWRVTEKKTREERPESDGGRTENIVVAITRPMPKFTPRMEPCLIVDNYNGDFAALIHSNHLEESVSDARAIYQGRMKEDAVRAANESLRGNPEDAPARSAPMKHTTTTTVPKRDAKTRLKHRPPPPSRHEEFRGTLHDQKQHPKNFKTGRTGPPCPECCLHSSQGKRKLDHDKIHTRHP